MAGLKDRWTLGMYSPRGMEAGQLFYKDIINPATGKEFSALCEVTQEHDARMLAVAFDTEKDKEDYQKWAGALPEENSPKIYTAEKSNITLLSRLPLFGIFSAPVCFYLDNRKGEILQFECGCLIHTSYFDMENDAFMNVIEPILTDHKRFALLADSTGTQPEIKVKSY